MMRKSILREHIDLIKEPLQRRQDRAEYKYWHEYKIYNADQHLINRKCKDSTMMTSRSFSSGANIEDDKWYIQVVFDHDRDSRYWAQVFFGSVGRSTYVRSILSLFVVDKDDKNIFIGSMATPYSLASYRLGDLFQKKTSEEELYLVNNTLTLRLKVTILLDDSMPLPEYTVMRLCPKADLPNYFKALYENRQQSASQVINIKGKQFFIHDTVIKIRCPRLLDIIASEDNQDDDNDDSSYNNNSKNYDMLLINQKMLKAFEELIKFLYTDAITDYNDCIVPLYIIACEYHLEALQRLCEKIFCGHYITMTNYTFFDKLAHQMNSGRLSSYVRSFKITNRIDN